MKLVKLAGSLIDFDEILRINDPKTNPPYDPAREDTEVIRVFLRNGSEIRFAGQDAEALRSLIRGMEEMKKG